MHVLASAGAFRTDGSFVHSPVFDAAVLRGLFQANVLALLLKERMISPELVERMRTWRNEGFHTYAGEEIPDIDDLEWIARLTSHIPDRGTQLVHYYGAYSNAHRGIARQREVFVAVPPENNPPDPPQPDSAWLAARRKSWARLIRRVYEVDPLLCRCGKRMRVVEFITQAPIIRKILDHIGRRFDPLKLQ